MSLENKTKTRSQRRHQPKHRTPKKDEILRAAAELFAEHSYDGVSVLDVAKAAGISKSTLYHYFDHKEQILGTIVVTTIRNLSRHIDDTVSAELTPRERFIAFMEEQAAFFEQNQMMFKILLTQLGGLTDLKLRDSAIEWRVRYEGLIGSIIEEGVRDQIFAEDRTDAVTRAVMASMYWLARWYNDHNPKSARQLNREYAELLLSGIMLR